ncbi:MAG: class I SAM-dependent methyltransferase [Alphaproteobacteria bacterium]|nr:class I SAM-dependent methyltransferase [Alphaproteobacteria bacterium]
MKRIALALAAVLAAVYRIVPFGLRRRIVMGLAVLESRIGSPHESLRRLYDIEDSLELVINERAMAHGAGEHPKHRLTDYHGFFAAHVAAGDRVLDIGCGYGAVARSIAAHVPGADVTGIDIEPANVAQANAAENPPNLAFVEGDATEAFPDGAWDVVVLSNVLEHIDDRPGFLSKIRERLDPGQILIRVPLFERSWHLPMRREVGANVFSDPDHRIEHTREEFEQEVAAAGLEIVELRTPWGEIWARCRAAGRP